ncbi:MAG: hypothetical protein RSA48_03210 [Bacilli bacterium]
MKKISRVILFSLILIMAFTFNRKDNKVVSVFMENNHGKEIYYLNTEGINLTSYDIDNRFKIYNIEIEYVYPSNSLSIEDNKLNIRLAKFYYTNKFTIQYVDILKEYGMFNEMEKILVFGIKIKGIKVKSSRKEIAKLISDNKKIRVVNYEADLTCFY